MNMCHPGIADQERQDDKIRNEAIAGIHSTEQTDDRPTK